jgi:hypothetical protein
MDSPGGIVEANCDRTDSSVAMGVPDFDPRSLPMRAEREAASYRIDLPGGPVEFGPCRSATRMRSYVCVPSTPRR